PSWETHMRLPIRRTTAGAGCRRSGRRLHGALVAPGFFAVCSGGLFGEPRMSASTSASRVAVIQAAPVVFDRERTLQKIEDLSADAAKRGAGLALFPEAFVSGYPRGLSFGAVVGNRTPEGREQYRRYCAR